MDTSFIYGLLAEMSPNHARALAILEQIMATGSGDKFFALNYVVQETYSVFSIRVHDAGYLDSLDDFFFGDASFIDIIYLDSNPHNDGAIIQIMKQNLLETSKRALSFVDAAQVYVAAQDQIDGIIAFDEYFDGIIQAYPNP